MALRTTITAVQKVLLSNYRKGVDLGPFLEIASAVTDRVSSLAAAQNRTLTDPELLQIETWLAAHFYQQSEKGYTYKSIGRTSGRFQGQTAMGLNNTNFGQAAITMDSSGCLQKLSEGTLYRNTAGVIWIGGLVEDVLDIEDPDE